MVRQRESLEQQALKRFEEVACEHGFEVIKGQGSDNRVPIRGNTYFQFGDLRVDTEEYHVVIEVESAGGVTNLVKYWYCLEGLEQQPDIIEKPVILFHIFRQSSEADYGSHLALWDFLWSKMNEALGNRMNAARYVYNDLNDIEAAVREFERYLG